MIQIKELLLGYIQVRLAHLDGEDVLKSPEKAALYNFKFTIQQMSSNEVIEGFLHVRENRHVKERKYLDKHNKMAFIYYNAKSDKAASDLAKECLEFIDELKKERNND